MKMVKLVKGFYVWLSLISLIIGMGIYLFFRGLNMIFFEYIPKPIILGMFYKPLPYSAFTGIILYNLPDMLWFLSGIFLLRFIWFNNKKWQNIYICCFYGIALIFETMQLLNNIPGTFDIMDLFFVGIGAFFEGLLYRKFINRRLI
jgi:hypothetical protein